MSSCRARTAAVSPVHMTQGLPREFLHPHRGSHLHRLHVQFKAQARLWMSPQCPVVMLRAGWLTAAARTKTSQKRARLLRASSTDFHNERSEARAGGGISGGVRPHPPAAHPLPGEQQLRRVPSRRKQEQGAGVAESCARNHKLERGRGGERTQREREGMQRKY